MKSDLFTAAVLCMAAVFYYPGRVSAQQRNVGWGAKVDLNLRTAWVSGQASGGTSLASVKGADNRARVFVVFDGEPGPLPGFNMTARGGNVAVGTLDLSQLPALATATNVRYIRSERFYHPNDDPGVRSVRAPRTSSRLGITGKGVLLGVIDTGIDWDHPDFLDSDGNTRIEAILDFSDDPDSMKVGELGRPGPYGGIAVYRQDIVSALAGSGKIRERDYVGHGTHVAGTAAASVSKDTINALGGVAREASLVVVKATTAPRDSSFSDYNIANGVVFLDSLAYFRNMPWVANMSLGSLLGPHDGTDPLETFLAGLVKAPRRGKAIVVSAGNSRNKHAHATGDFSQSAGGTTDLALNVSVGSGRDDYVVAEIWLSENHPGLAYDIYAPDSTLLASLADGDTMTVDSGYGILLLENAFGGVNPLNGDRLISIILADRGATNQDTTVRNNQLAAGMWRIVMHSSIGSWHAYVTSNYGVVPTFDTYSVQSGTINVPATSPDLIAAGAYNVRGGWMSLSGGAGSLGLSLGSYPEGELTYFTSLGPTRDGRMKPEITAPGRWVMGSLSADAWPDEPLSIFTSPYVAQPLLLIATDSLHAVSQGTSFSAPHVAGVVALLLDVKPALSNNEIISLLTSTAATDSQSVAAPDNNWGYGRVNAAGAVAKALDIQSDTVRLSAGSDPPDTLRAASFSYAIDADFRNSIQAPTSYTLRVTWPPENIRLAVAPDSMALGGAIRLTAGLDSLSSGVLRLSAKVLETPPDSFALAELEFAPRSAGDIDGVQVSYQALSLSGDLAGDILGSLRVSQSAPLSFRLAGMCLMEVDLDNNGKRDIFDVLELLQIVAKRTEATLCSDIDGNGKTDIFDVIALLKLLRQD